MNNNETACSNCTCPLNYDCEKFKLFFEGNYSFVEEYMHNGNYSCDHKDEELQQINIAAPQKGLF